MKMIRVIAKKDGFRRAGRAWSGTAEVPASEFSKEQIEQLQAESDKPGGQLVVQEFDQAEEKPATSKAPGKAPAEQK